MVTQDIERALISSIILDDGTLQKSIDLDESIFTTTFNRTVVNTINALKRKNKPTDELTIAYYLRKNNLFNEVMFLDILCANPFGSINTITNYINILKREKATRFSV